ncbi:MAG: polyprenyl synthetase family protein [Ktedonobacteraceae bacterium]|nr:polyprenyl synthetase family protein [Ktedonobacteraceae bacterium]
MLDAFAELLPSQKLLQEALLKLLENVSPPLQGDTIVALTGKNKLLSSSQETLPAGIWPLMTFLMAQYLQPDADLQLAISTALAVECLLCAFDILDDIEDGDITPILQTLGSARSLNVATALLMLAQRSLCAPSPSQTDQRWRVWDTFIENGLLACGGQHQDLLAEQQPVEHFQAEDALMIAETKSGSLMQLACLLGALSVEASEEICTIVAEMGLALGVAHQLDNDAHDLSTALQASSITTKDLPPVKSDLRRGKKTLPIILAAQQKTLQDNSIPADTRNRDLLQEGIVATWSACLVYRTQVRSSLNLLTAIVQRPLSPALKCLIGLTE